MAPTLTDNLLAPTENASFTEGKIFVSGRAEDTNNAPGRTAATSKVEVAIIDGTGKYLTSTGTFAVAESWRAAFLTSPGTPGSNFSYTTPVLPEGSYTVKVRAIDQHGLVTAVPSVRHVTVTIPPGNQKPVAVLQARSCAGERVPFDARGSTDENAATLTYTWSFGVRAGHRHRTEPQEDLHGRRGLHGHADGEGRVGRRPPTRSRQTFHDLRAGRQHRAGGEDPGALVQRPHLQLLRGRHDGQPR